MYIVNVLYIISLRFIYLCIKIYRCLLMDAALKNPCTINPYNLNTTYHFLGRRQSACYVNYLKLAVQIHPRSFLLFLIG
jgi:hypothetical protein